MKLPKVVIGSAVAWYLIAALMSLTQKAPVRDEICHLRFGYEVIDYGARATTFRGVGWYSVLNVIPLKITGWAFVPDSRARFAARSVTVLLGGLLVLFSGLFAWRLYGPWSGAVAAILTGTEPNLLAHGRLVTADLPFSFGTILFLYLLFQFKSKRSIKNCILAGIGLGFVLATKTTALIFIPLTPFLLLIPEPSTHDDSSKSFLTNTRAFPILLVTAILFINLLYGFTGSFQPISNYSFNSRNIQFLENILPTRTPLPLPEPYVRCLDDALYAVELKHPVDAYLMGRFSSTGFLYYFPVAFAVKTSCGMLVLIATAILSGLFRRHRFQAGDWFLILSSVWIFTFFSLFGRINIGLRYILPVYPLLAIFSSRLTAIDSTRWMRVMVYPAIIMHLIASLTIHPHYLEFFNGFSGGPSNGYKWLSDSNLCWGQDLNLLRAYEKQHHIKLILNPREKTGGWIALNTNRIINPSYRWLQDYSPVDRVAYTWFIYHIDLPKRTENISYLSESESDFKHIDTVLKGPEKISGDRSPQVLKSVEAVSAQPTYRSRVLSKNDDTLLSSNRFNILLITIDTLRADHLGCYGHPLGTSPWIDRLSQKGTLWMETRCEIPQTTPSHASLLTGLYPCRQGSYINCLPIRPNTLILSTLLKHRGYSTGAVVASSMLTGNASGLNAGFDWYDDHQLDPAEELPDTNRPVQSIEESPPEQPDMIQFAFSAEGAENTITPFERRGETVTRHALTWLGNVTSKGKPFFLWMHFYDPHSAYNPPNPYQKLFTPFYAPIGELTDIIRFKSKNIKFNLSEHNRFHAFYDGEIRYTDAQIGRILMFLAQKHLLDKTIIILTADHGETLGEYKSYVGHGKFLNEGSLRIPLIIFIPSRRNASISADSAQITDILPSVLSDLRVPLPENLDGRPDLLKNPTTSKIKQTIFIQSAILSAGDFPRIRLGVIDGRYKYICLLDTRVFEMPSPSRNDFKNHLYHEALYDLNSVSGESINLLDTHGDTVDTYREEIITWLSTTWRHFRNKPSINPSMKKALKALGYIQ